MKKSCSSCKNYLCEECVALAEKGVRLLIYSPYKENNCYMYRPIDERANRLARWKQEISTTT